MWRRDHSHCPIPGCEIDHLARLFRSWSAVVNAGQDVGMNVDHVSDTAAPEFSRQVCQCEVQLGVRLRKPMNVDGNRVLP